jgi:tetratricopeptide (TPR) repeat protein
MIDSTKLVRIGSAQLVVGFEGEGWTEAEKLSLFEAKEELEEMLFSNADFSTGRLQLGDYFMQANDIKPAIKHYEIALKMDSLLFPVYTNLATAYSIDQQTDRALETLNTWIDKQPDAGRPYYLRALLNFEIGNNEIAEEDLKMAIELDPRDSRAMYNLATYYYQSKQFQKAESEIKKALIIESNNQEIKYLYALILKELGKVKEANRLMKELQTS